MNDGKIFSYPGVSTGFRIERNPQATIDRLAKDLLVIDAAALPPWQKTDAIKTFLLPRLDHLLSAYVQKKYLIPLDRTIKKCVKKWLYLPSRASPELTYISPRHGDAGVLPVSDQTDIYSPKHLND